MLFWDTLYTKFQIPRPHRRYRDTENLFLDRRRMYIKSLLFIVHPEADLKLQAFSSNLHIVLTRTHIFFPIPNSFSYYPSHSISSSVLGNKKFPLFLRFPWPPYIILRWIPWGLYSGRYKSWYPGIQAVYAGNLRVVPIHLHVLGNSIRRYVCMKGSNESPGIYNNPRCSIWFMTWAN